MARRRYTKKESEAALVVLAVVILAILAALVSLWNFLVETKLIWFVPVVLVGAVILRWFLRKRAEKSRVNKILAHRDEWGEEMCQWLISEGVSLSDKRVERVLARLDMWGADTIQQLIQQRISLGMTDDMVMLSLGKPTSIDLREVSTRGEKFRWIYGVPRKGAAYIWFKDGKVTKIKQ